MRNLLASTAILLGLAAPAFASSGQQVIDMRGASITVNGVVYGCIKIIMQDDGILGSDGTYSGTIYTIPDMDLTVGGALSLARALQGAPLVFNTTATPNSAAVCTYTNDGSHSYVPISAPRQTSAAVQ